MEIIDITEDNVEDFLDYIEPDVYENIGRRFFRAIAVLYQDAPQAALVWKVVDAENEERETSARLVWMEVSDSNAGKPLMDAYTERVAAEGVTRSYFCMEKTEKNAISLLKRSGFKVEEAEHDDVIVTLKDLLDLKLVQIGNIPSNIIELGALKSRSFRSGVIDCMYHIHRDLLEDLSALSLDWYEPEISCYEESNGNINGYFLIHRLESGRFRTELLADWGPDEKYLMYMIRFCVRRAAKLYPEDSEVIIHRHDEATYHLTERLFPGAKGKDSYRGERKEA